MSKVTDKQESKDASQHTLQDVKIAVLASSLAYYVESFSESKNIKSQEKYYSYLQKIEKELGKKVVSIKPFYKGDKNFAGHVIETEGEILVCYHGTRVNDLRNSGIKEVLSDLRAKQSKMEFASSEEPVSVHTGFKKEFGYSKDSLYKALESCGKEKPLHLTGHSLGGAVAQIAALDLSLNKDRDVSKVTTFGGAVVFGKKAAGLYEEKGLSDKTMRVINTRDPVPMIVPMGYYHSGNAIKISSENKGRHLVKAYRSISESKLTDDHLKTEPDLPPKRSLRDYYRNIIMKMSKIKFISLSASLKNIRSKFKQRAREAEQATRNSRKLNETNRGVSLRF